jgi:hypothetical protein
VYLPDALKAAWLDLLEGDRDLVAPEKIRQKMSDRRFVGGEARDPREIHCEADHLCTIVSGQDSRLSRRQCHDQPLLYCAIADAPMMARVVRALSSGRFHGTRETSRQTTPGRGD